MNSVPKIRRVIYNTFTKKYGLHLQSDAAQYLQETLANERDLVGMLETIIKTYKKRNAGEKSIILDEATVQDVITSIKTSAVLAKSFPFQREEDTIHALGNMMIRDNSSLSLTSSQVDVNVAQHFHVVDAFALPKLTYDDFTRTFKPGREAPGLLSSPQGAADTLRERYALTKQRLMRNEAFGPGGDSSGHIKITSIKNLAGEDGKQFTLFGMLERRTDSKLYLEDLDAMIELDVSQCVYEYGLFTGGMLVIVEGVFGKDHVFHVSEINLPPAEARDMTDAVMNDIDFFGLPKPLVDEHLLRAEEQRHEDIFFVIVSDVYLDQPRVLESLKKMMGEYQTQLPLAFILIGNFFSRPDPQKYKQGFNALADLFGAHANLATHTNVVLVPGPQDPWGSDVLPQFPLPAHFLGRLKQKVQKLHVTSNPCRIRYCTQDIVIFRENVLDSYLRNLVLPVNLHTDPNHTNHLVRTMLDQAHLFPLLQRATFKDFEHANILFPLPHTIVLADRIERYSVNYEGTHCLNPGSFTHAGMSWTTYYPHAKISNPCSLAGV